MSPQNPLTLTNIPPELLLAIISHLPTSSSLYALSLTSHTLATFLHTHAQTICNNFITQNQLYSRAATILQSTYTNGWLVPSHPCVADAEEQWQHELSSRSDSRASTPAHNTHGMKLQHGCCFRSDSYGSNSSDERAPRPRLRSRLSRREHVSEGERGRTPLSPSQAPLLTPPSMTKHTDPSLSLSLGLPLPFKLSRPGPHYLVFLERYATEIVTRWEMDVGRLLLRREERRQRGDRHFIRASQSDSSSSSNSSVKIKDDDDDDAPVAVYGEGTPLEPIDEVDEVEDEDDDDDEEELEKLEMQFGFMLKVYCVRSWLVLCHNAFVIGEGNGIPFTEVQHSTCVTPQQESKVGNKMKAARKNVTAVARKWRRGLKELRKKTTPAEQKQPPRKLLFGEVDAESASSLGLQISSERGSNKSTSVTFIERDCWVKGLLWFYGIGGHLSFSSARITSAASRTMEDDFEYHEKDYRGKWYHTLKDEHVKLQVEMNEKRRFGAVTAKIKQRWCKISLRLARGFERIDGDF